MAVESFSLSSLSRIHRYRAGAACPATVSHSQSSSLHSVSRVYIVENVHKAYPFMTF